MLGVDDNATNRTLLEGHLKAWGMQIDCVADGAQALAHLCAAHHDGRPYALVILDMQMPHMNGLELAHIIKADADLAPVRLVLLSSGRQCDEEQSASGGRYCRLRGEASAPVPVVQSRSSP